MPSLFGSRRYSAPVQPLTRETADPDAATAAASAFMRRGSNASLSSAAAAAALRARPMTPTNVAQVQSRRVHRRSPSLSSLGGRDGKPKRELQRSPSVGSMIERTFRSPSPGRDAMGRTRNVPPVPTVPLRVAADQGAKAKRNSSMSYQGLNTQPLRTASERLKNGQRSSWFAGATSGDASNVRRPDIVIHSASASLLSEPHSGSVSPSINFSYPRARTQSPTPSMDDQTLVYDANSRRMIPRRELIAMSQSLDSSYETESDRTAQPPINANAPGQPLDSAKKKKTKNNKAKSAATDKTALDGDSAMARPPLAKKPSVVEEEPEMEAEEASTGQSVARQTPTASPSAAARAQGKGTNNRRKDRVPSESPARSARFASAPDHLIIKHEPPPRSISPRKSAMKLCSPRGVSPSEDGSEASGRGPSPNHGEDGGLVRKKSARVSWDDRNTVVVGESAPAQDPESPVLPSPQPKKPWHSIVSKHKKESLGLSEDETMGPRPALPLFGSVRDKKSKEVGERPLVRPSDKTWTQPSTDSLSSDAAIGHALAQDYTSRNAANISKYREPLPAAAANTDAVENTEGVEDTAAVEKTAAGPKDADSSDDDLESDAETGAKQAHASKEADESECQPTARHDDKSGIEGREAEKEDEPKEDETKGFEETDEKARAIPDASVENGEADKPTVPGGFPGDVEAEEGLVVEEAPLASAAAIPEPSEPSGGILSPSMDKIREEEEEEEKEADRCSVYSDACEDLQEVDGQGFMSLDAVVESRGGAKLKKKVQEHASQSPGGDAGGSTKAGNDAQGAEPGQAPPPAETTDDWEKAKAYWKSLTTEERRRLELEALAEGGEDHPVDTKPSGRVVASDSVPERSYQIAPGTKWDEAAAQRVFVASPQPSTAATKTRRAQPVVAAAAAQSAAAAPQPVAQSPPKMPLTLRGEAAPVSEPDAGGMRKTMRPATSPQRPSKQAGLGDGGMRQSLRADSGISLTPGVPLIPALRQPTLAHRRNQSAHAPLSRRGGMRPGLARQASDDSVSSFKRSRRRNASVQGIRTSMRHEALEPMSPASIRGPSLRGSGRFSLRSLSPPAFRRNSMVSVLSTQSSMGGSRHMRHSLRSEPTSPTSRPRSRMSSLNPLAKKAPNMYSDSRFADSSDEDEPASRLFNSRFDDSSDDEGTKVSPTLASKSKRLMRSHGDNSSLFRISLPSRPVSQHSHLRSRRPTTPTDASDHDGPSRSAAGLVTPMPDTAHSHTAHSSTALPDKDAGRPSRARRSSIMSILRRRRDSPAKISRDVTESAARRGTHLERTPDELASIRSGSNWPLHSSNDDDQDVSSDATGANRRRPATAHATGSSALRMLLRRRHTSSGPLQDDDDDDDGDDADAPPRRKKKFPALRRMFGIED